MPAATTYWTELERMGGNAYRNLQEIAEAERRARSDWHARVWDYYDGAQPRPLKVRHGQADNNVIINEVAQHVNHTVSFAAPEFPQITVDEGSDEINALIADFWKAQYDNIWLSNTLMAGVLEGHPFVRIMPVEGAPARLITVNPANVLAYWTEDDVDTALWYEQTYVSGGDRHRLDILTPGLDGNAGWQFRDHVMRQSRFELVEVIDWPYPFAPIWDWQHLPHPNRYYGRHELDMLGLQDSINKVASDIKAILRTHASPRVVGFGFKANQLEETAIDAFWSTPNVEAKIAMLEMQSDLASSMGYLSYLTGQYRAQARVTILTGGPDAYKGVTNLGIKAAFMAQVAKTETIRALYGEALASLTQIGLALQGVVIDLPRVTWANNLPTSDLEKAQVAQLEINMGIISKQTAAEDMGIDWEAEQERLAADEENMGGALERLLGGPLPAMQMQPQRNGNGRVPQEENA